MTSSAGPWVRIAPEVADALRDARPVVALESSLIAHGLPAPHNLETAAAAERAVRDAGAVPATVAIADGRLLVGAPPDVLEQLADLERGAAKAASRDIGPLLAAGALAATTVSATMRAAHLAGIGVFGTGGIGGVHRGAADSWDVSSDVDELAATPVGVVCSGAKSILDLRATAELLETRRVPVVGIGTRELPAFYSATSGIGVAHTVPDAAGAAAALAAHLALPGAGAMLLVNPPPGDVALRANEVEAWIDDGLRAAARDGIRGGAVTPYVLGHVARVSDGRALRANIGLIVNNARTAAEVAVALAGRGPSG